MARDDSFKPDPDVKTGSASLEDYKGSGYDRGHLAPAADMKMSPVSVDTVEMLTSIDFYPLLPDGEEEIIESGIYTHITHFFFCLSN